MNHRSARTLREVAQEDAIDTNLTLHEHYVANRTITLRMAEIAEKLATQVKEDRYVISTTQAKLTMDLRELLAVHEALAGGS